MHRLQSTALAGFLAVLGACLLPQHATAAYEKAVYTFNQSNTFADGVNYGTLTVESYDGVGTGGGGLSAGQIRITADPATSPYTSTDNFGFQSLGFNFKNLTLTAGDIDSVPTGWTFDITAPPNNEDGFGKFDANAAGDGSSRRDPLVILISNQGTAALIENVTIANDKGNYFAGHVAGFTVNGSNDTSHYIAVNDLTEVTVVPVPPAIALLASGVPLLLLGRLVRRHRKPAAA